jgi:hypothetical protein
MTSRADDLRRCVIAECENEPRSPKIHSLFCSKLMRYSSARLRMAISELAFEAWVSGFAEFLLRGRPHPLAQNRR